ncbi:MAG TPA: four helix bundle protein [Longimicrobiales bacterium]
MRDFRKLLVFPKAHSLALFVYRSTRLLPRQERFGLAQQMRGCARSIPANLVEGCGRRTRHDLAHFIDMSIGSANELLYYSMLCRDLEYLPPDVCQEIERRVTEVIRMLVALARAIRTRPGLGDRPEPPTTRAATPTDPHALRTPPRRNG